ncbi:MULTISPECIES: adenine phosphoribosyltransferase [unclassified Capnocytophaga]|jgi:adenine phosphoribosyltransferase|uniref:adenine phosphoribosyltransferase n=1 Tax=unclassified Capnocytophaga TaxID=2640652 RepID=UPI000202D6BC|nr:MULTISPECIES: adenine phosphoribosyltransferase [unclassified Capnocytophaga]EGD33852.1 adenine phosphoribosyltransferase [Capnocytophaga sp. oral taxon 338 str. F0234]MEB3004972.1 adenine phosphoribosyltransferase [Capnocytophaga sp. G2]
MDKTYIENFVRDIPDFPKKGVLFKDITPILDNAKATQEALRQLLAPIKDEKIDKVAGIESRGFLFGILLAQALGVGFIPIRKPGKLPAQTISESYDLEYGNSRLEVHTDALVKGEKVLIHDDILATGGTALAATRLIERLGGEVVQCSFLMELSFLNGREKLHKYQINSILNY